MIARMVADGGEVVREARNRIDDIATSVTTRGEVLTTALSRKIEDANTALATRAAEVADNLENQIGRFEVLIGRAGQRHETSNAYPHSSGHHDRPDREGRDGG